MDPIVQDLIDRVERLETRQARLDARVSFTGDGAIALIGPVRVVDSNGKAMLEVDLDSTGPRVRLLTGLGTTAVLLHVSPTGGSVAVYGQTGRPAALVFADEVGGEVATYDLQGVALSSEG